MPDPQLDKLIEDRDAAIARNAAKAAERAEQDRQDNELTATWLAAYTDAPLITNAVADEIARRLVHLADTIRDRFWDFHIAELLASGTAHVCIRLLAHACAGHAVELPDYVLRARNFFPSAYTTHVDLLDHLRVRAIKGLPQTPPLTLSEIAGIIGVTRDKFRGDLRAGRWTTVDTERYQRRRRWRCSDAGVQKAVLTKIRTNFSEKMWSDLR